MTRVSVDRRAKPVRDFVSSLAAKRGGAIVELNGEPVLRVVPAPRERVDPAKLKAAILRRRRESLRVHREWEHIDREMWNRIP